MISGEDLAFVRLAMRRRLVSVARIREAVERKKWDQADRNIAQILIEMGALDPKAVASLMHELGSDERVTVSSELAKHAAKPISEKAAARPPSERGQVKPVSAPIKPSVESDDAHVARPKHPTRIGRYEITKLLGAGAMGAVYAARDPDLDRDVAIKVLQGEGAPTARAIARFRREAKLTARLDHPNIVRIHGAGVEDGYHFIAMDLVDGRSLAELVAIGEVTPRRAIHLARKIALAVQHAHERGVLHRDLKPANVLVDEQGEPRVTDFGLAVLTEPDESDRLTRTGAAVGTPAYMSPEQARGELSEIDARTDVYSLGSTLYEMLTGGPPFEAPTFLELARKICDADPTPPRKRNPEVPIDLDTICMKALEKEKPARFQSADEMARDLERLLHDEPVVAKRPSRGKRAKRWAARRPGFVSLCAAVVILATGVAGRWYRQPGEARITTHPAGARVYLNGVDKGPSPVTLPFLPAGVYTLEFALEGYDRVPVGDPRVEVGRGNTTSREIDLVPLKGTLKLTSSPAGAKVQLSRVVSGSESPLPDELTTPVERLLPEGDYVARLTLAGSLVPAPVRGIHVGKGGAETVVPTVTLQPDDASLELEVEPRGTIVRAERDGTVIEASAVGDSVPIKLGAGTYQVLATKPGYLPWLFTGPVAGNQRRRAALTPARAFTRGVQGTLKLAAPPVAGDISGSGAVDTLVLEDDDEGRWLTLLGGGGERGFRWRERTDATAILPVLGDADRDGVLDVALEVPGGFEVRDGQFGRRFFRTPVPQLKRGEVQGGVVRSCAFATQQGTLGVVGAAFASPETASVRLTVSGLGLSAGRQTLDLLDEGARSAIGNDWPRTAPASRPAVVLIADSDLESEGMDIRGRRHVVALAFSQRLIALDAPIELVTDERNKQVLRACKPPIVVAVPASSPESLVLSADLDRVADGEVVVVPPKGPLSLVSIGRRAELGRFGLADSQFHNARVVNLKRGKHELTVLSVHDATTNKTHVIGFDRTKGGIYRLGMVEQQEAIVLAAEPFARSLARAHHPVEEALFWAHGHVFDMAGIEIPSLSTETQGWALDGPLVAADLDGDGAPEVIAPTRDGHGLAVLSLQPALRFRARPAEVRESADVRATLATELAGEGDLAIVQLTATRLVAFDAKDGRVRWSAPVPEGALGVVALASGVHSHDLVVLARKTLERFRGADGGSVWKADSHGAQAIVAAGGDCCGCGEEDVLLADPTGLVSGQTGKALFTLAPSKAAASRALPITAPSGKNERRVYAVVSEDDSGKVKRSLVRLTPHGKVEFSLPVPEGAGPLAAIPAADSTSSAGLLVGWGNEIRLIAPGAAPESISPLLKRPGKVLGFALAQPELPLSKLVILEDAPSPEGGRDARGAIALCMNGSQTLWARGLPAGPQPPVGPVFLDSGDRVAFVAPSGAIVILRMSDGKFLGERHALEGTLGSVLASYATGEGSLLLSLTDAGELLAFDAATADRSEKNEDERQTIQELARKSRFGIELARKACDDLLGWQGDASNKPAAALALAEARLNLADFEGPEQDDSDLKAARDASESALKVAPLLAQAVYDGARARIRIALKEQTPSPRDLAGAREDIVSLAALRTKDAAGLGAEVSTLLLERDANEALRFADLAVHASPLDVRARKARVLARLRLLPSSDKDLASPETKHKLELMREDLDVANESNARSLKNADPELIVIETLTLLAQGDTGRAREMAKRGPAGAQNSDVLLLANALAKVDVKESDPPVSELLAKLVEREKSLHLGSLAKLIEKR